MRAVIYPGSARGRVRVPSSKSISHRALLAAALAEGQTVLEGLDRSEDLRATCKCRPRIRRIGAVAARGPDAADRLRVPRSAGPSD